MPSLLDNGSDSNVSYQSRNNSYYDTIRDILQWVVEWVYDILHLDREKNDGSFNMVFCGVMNLQSRGMLWLSTGNLYSWLAHDQPMRSFLSHITIYWFFIISITSDAVNEGGVRGRELKNRMGGIVSAAAIPPKR